MINVFSEIGKLKEVMLHRPGEELENLTPDLLQRLLFDDIPFLQIAREEHDAFAKILQEKGVKVLYLEKLVAETISQSQDLKENFIKQFITEAGIEDEYSVKALFEYLNSMNEQDLVNKAIAGIRKEEVKIKANSVASMSSSSYPFICDPLPNAYFTRDPFACMGNGVTINHMHTVTRNRETLLGEYIFTYHKDYKNTPKYYNRNETTSIEGGDELILNEKTLAIGISERTQAESIDKLAKNLFKEGSSFKEILAFKIPSKRAFMHLDTVFTQIDYDKFTIHPEAEANLTVYSITSNGNDVNITEKTDKLSNILSKVVGKDVTLIECGGGDPIVSAREQWNDGANTLAIAPGEVVVYSRNHVTNKILEDHGIIVHRIPSSELSRGRGGPRCMSMPFQREKI